MVFAAIKLSVEWSDLGSKGDGKSNRGDCIEDMATMMITNSQCPDASASRCPGGFNIGCPSSSNSCCPSASGSCCPCDSSRQRSSGSSNDRSTQSALKLSNAETRFLQRNSISFFPIDYLYMLTSLACHHERTQTQFASIFFANPAILQHEHGFKQTLHSLHEHKKRERASQ